MGKALAQVGDTADGCLALSDGAHFLHEALVLGKKCTTSIYSVLPESPNRNAPTCSEFDSSYQNVSVNFLVWLFANMPASGLPDPIDNTTITTAAVFSEAIQAMNREYQAIDTSTAAGTNTPAWCYGGSDLFQYGEISECGNSRITGGLNTTHAFDAISATMNAEEFGQFVNLTAPGDFLWIDIADQIGQHYATGYIGPVDRADPYQPYYL